jgi:hypothetical protein
LLLLLRRTHLYTGLALLPWICVYGFSALLFNHPTWLSEREVHSIDPAAFEGTAFEELSTPDELAERILQAVATALETDALPTYEFGGPSSRGPRIELPPPPTLSDVTGAHFRGSIQFRVDRESAHDSIVFDPTGLAALDYTIPPRQVIMAAHDPFVGVRKLDVQAIDGRALLDDLPAVLESAGLEGGKATLRGLPDLAFDFQVDGELWHGDFDLERKRFSTELAVDEFDEHAARNLFARLHKTHIYAPAHNARWLWAAFVDALGLLLLFWSASGILMWWQLRRARRVGLIVLGLATLVAVALISALAST